VLAPVLARLDAIPGVTAARVDSSGRFFWLALEEPSLEAGVRDAALGVLGAGALVLPAAQARAQVASQRRGDPWHAAGDVMTLSYVESRMLSVRIAGEVERLLGTSGDERERIGEAIRTELFAAMERVHAEGGRRSGGWIYDAWPAIAGAVVERCAEPLPGVLRDRLAEVLPTLLTR